MNLENMIIIIKKKDAKNWMVPFLERSKRGKRKLGSSLMDLTVHKSRKCLPQESGEWLPGEGPWEGLGSGR